MDQITVAVGWWAKKLRSSVVWWTWGKIPAFKAKLAEVLEEDRYWGAGIGLEHRPDDVLGPALEAAQFDPRSFVSWHILMTFQEGGVQVANGYESEPVEILL